MEGIKDAMEEKLTPREARLLIHAQLGLINQSAAQNQKRISRETVRNLVSQIKMLARLAENYYARTGK